VPFLEVKEEALMSYLGKVLLIVGLMMLPLFGAAAKSTEEVLYSFAGSDGSAPSAGLVSDASGDLYGTTQSGGFYGYGTVFELTPTQRSGWTESVLYSFTGGADGSGPVSNLIFDTSGNLYGTTAYGGTYGVGTAFELVRSSGWTLNTLWSFGSGSDGILPEGSLAFDQSGNLYGTLDSGGAQNAGAVFKLTPHHSGWSERIIHSFANMKGSRPWAGVTVDAAGNVYGTTLYNGPGEGGSGTVFKLAPVAGKWKFSIIHDFNKGGGGGPFGGVILDLAGNLYGTTYGEGSCSATVYKLAPVVKGPWKLRVLHSFDGTDGCQIYGAVTMNSVGNLYGATYGGGANSDGTVFELTPDSKGHYVRRTLYNFKGGTDGADPLFMAVILDSSGSIYGTTYDGGTSALGTVFEVNP
jgi:uncharacterized repeat protein (TIGR03803 family)